MKVIIFNEMKKMMKYDNDEKQHGEKWKSMKSEKNDNSSNEIMWRIEERKAWKVMKQYEMKEEGKWKVMWNMMIMKKWW